MDLLAFLATTGGRVVSKDEIIDAVWEGRFIAEATLTRSIADLRRALNDNQRCPQYIETIAKRGTGWLRRLQTPAGIPSRRHRRTPWPPSRKNLGGSRSRRACHLPSPRIPSVAKVSSPAGVSPTGWPWRGEAVSSVVKRRSRSSARHCWPTNRPSWCCTSPEPAAWGKPRCSRSSRALPTRPVARWCASTAAISSRRRREYLFALSQLPGVEHANLSAVIRTMAGRRCVARRYLRTACVAR